MIDLSLDDHVSDEMQAPMKPKHINVLKRRGMKREQSALEVRTSEDRYPVYGYGQFGRGSIVTPTPIVQPASLFSRANIRTLNNSNGVIAGRDVHVHNPNPSNASETLTNMYFLSQMSQWQGGGYMSSGPALAGLSHGLITAGI